MSLNALSDPGGRQPFQTLQNKDDTGYHARVRVTCLFLSVLLFVASATAAPPPADGSVSASAAVATAREHFDAHRYREALDWLRYAQTKVRKASHLIAMAGTLERLGRYADAQATYQRSLTEPGAKRFKARIQAEIRRMQPLATQAWVQLKPEALYQIDGKPVSDVRRDQPLSAGVHAGCARADAATALTCWRRELAVGRRVVWPPTGGVRGSVRLPEGAVLTHVDTREVLLDTRGVSLLKVDAGPRTVRVSLQGASHALEAMVKGGQESVLALPKPDLGPTTGASELAARPDDPGHGYEPWLVAGTGLAVLGTGVALLVVAAGDQSTLDDQRALVDDNGVIQGISQRDASAKQGRIDGTTTYGIVFASAGAIALTTAIVILALPPNAGEEDASWRVVPAPTGVSLHSRF